MKELNDLERRLESWTPRRPSWKVKRRAWAAAASAAGPAGELGVEFPSLRLGWLAPAAMALLLSCVLFNQRSASLFYASGDCGPLVVARQFSARTKQPPFREFWMDKLPGFDF